MTENKLIDADLLKKNIRACIKNNEIEFRPVVDNIIEIERNIKRKSIPIIVSEVKKSEEVVELNKLIDERDRLYVQLGSKISGLSDDLFKLAEIESEKSKKTKGD